MRSSYVPRLGDEVAHGAAAVRSALARRQSASSAVVASVAVHVLAAFTLERTPVPSAPRPVPRAVIELVAPPRESAREERTPPEPAREPTPPRRAPPEQRPRALEPRQPPDRAAPPEPEEDPYAGAPPPSSMEAPSSMVAPSGEAGPAGPALLTGGDGAGWAAPSGGGGGGGARVARPRAMQPAPGATADRVVALSDLSRPPAPPSLDGALRRLYPEQARREGRSGEATVRARIGPAGAVVEIRVERATDPTFGGACRALLARSRWSPPLDRGGLPVSTWIRYTCRFSAER